MFQRDNHSEYDIVNTQDFIIFENKIKQLLNDNKYREQLANVEFNINALERQLLLESSTTCTVKKLDTFQDKLPNINALELKQLLQKNFYDPVIMQNIMCTVNSLFYLQPQHAGAVYPNERVKHWLTQLQQIGKESVEGFAFKSNFSIANSAFVIKAPRNTTNDLIHEFLIGMQLNSLRSYVPNFSYTFGGFRCSPPILKEEYNPIGRIVDRIPASWCGNNSSLNVQYIIYENIAPAVSFGDYVKKCSFEQFLDKYTQILLALLVAQELKDFCHYDLHSENVLIRSMGRNISIPYRNEKNVIEYINTDGISTIIDYGRSHVKLSNGKSLGATGYVRIGTYADILIPLFDAYKLLMFCMREMLTAKNFVCLQKTERLFRFFNRSESVQDALNKQANFYYTLPLNNKTADIGLIQYLKYIRRNIPEISSVLTSQPLHSRVLGCTGNDICVSDGEAINILGYNTPKVINDVFNFFDLVSRFEEEGRMSDIEEVLSIFDLNTAIKSAYDDYNRDVNKIYNYFVGKKYETISINNLLIGGINSEAYDIYKDFLITTAEIQETFEHAVLVYDAIKFVSKYYPLDNKSLDATNKEILVLYNDFNLVIDSIKQSAIELGPNRIAKLNLPELEILSKK